VRVLQLFSDLLMQTVRCTRNGIGTLNAIENGVEYDLFSRENKQPDEDILRGRNGTVLGFIGVLSRVRAYQ
jgi:hypothetical protein